MAQQKTYASPVETVNSSLTHRPYSPAAASATLTQTDAATFRRRTTLNTGTSTMYKAVIKPALPEDVVSSPFCWNQDAAAMAAPQKSPPFARSSQDPDRRPSHFRRTAHRPSRNANATADRAALKVKAPT